MVTQFNKKDLMSFAKSVNPDKEVGERDFQDWLSSKDENSVLIRKPRIGDIVIYIPSPEQDYDKHARNNYAKEVPAIVTAVWSEECINITVFPDAPYGVPDESGYCPAAISITSVTKLPAGTHNPQTGMWKFK